MAIPKRSSPPTVAHSLKQRVITCLNKLSDRDTHTLATTELEQIVNSLTHDSFSSFLACIYDTDSSHKPPVRKQCVRLLGLLSSTHGEALQPHLTKMISNIIKRLRDSDSVVRLACVDSVTRMSTHVTVEPSLTTFLKPLMETMLVEQDINSQMGSALCLSSVIDASGDPEPAQLQRVLPKLVKLLKCESFKAKPALLSVVRSVIGVEGSVNGNILRNLVSCLVEFLSCEDWAVRKAAAEVFLKLAVVQKDMLFEFKSACLSSFEARRFDKVKVVRETMNQMIEAWKDVRGDSDDIWSPMQSKFTSSGKTKGECSPSSSVSSNAVGYDFPQAKRKPLARRSSFPLSNDSSVTTAKKKSPLKSKNRTATLNFLQNMDTKKPSDWKVEVSFPQTPSGSVNYEENYDERNEKVEGPGANEEVHNSEINESSQHQKPERRGNIFRKSNDEKMHMLGRLNPGTHVVPYDESYDECSESTVSNDIERNYQGLKEREDLSLIRNQLVQIENQQSSLLDLLQRFMGTSQNGIRSLETRVNGLEMALDEVMHDLTVSTGRMSPSDISDKTCCKLPGAEFLSPKFWKKSEGRYSNSKITSAESTPSLYKFANEDDSTEPSKLENLRFYHQAGGGGGFVVNPLATDIRNDMRRNSEIYSNIMPTTLTERRQARNHNGF